MRMFNIAIALIILSSSARAGQRPLPITDARTDPELTTITSWTMTPFTSSKISSPPKDFIPTKYNSWTWNWNWTSVFQSTEIIKRISHYTGPTHEPQWDRVSDKAIRFMPSSTTWAVSREDWTDKGNHRYLGADSTTPNKYEEGSIRPDWFDGWYPTFPFSFMRMDSWVPFLTSIEAKWEPPKTQPPLEITEPYSRPEAMFGMWIPDLSIKPFYKEGNEPEVKDLTDSWSLWTPSWPQPPLSLPITPMSDLTSSSSSTAITSSTFQPIDEIIATKDQSQSLHVTDTPITLTKTAKHRHSSSVSEITTLTPAVSSALITVTVSDSVTTAARVNTTKPKTFNKEFGAVQDIVLIGSNGILAVLAVAFNSLVIKYYRRQVKKLVPLVYFLISVTDVVTCVSCLLHPVVLGLILLSPAHTSLASTLLLTSFLFSSTSIRTSVFFNVVLSVIRSINIVRPFYQVRQKYVRLASSVYPIVWTAVVAVDVYWIVSLGYFDRPVAMFKHLIYRPMAGSGLAALALDDDATYMEIILLGMTVPFILPCLIVLVCLVLQIHFLSAPNKACDPGSKMTIPRRPAITIFQLSLLFVVCNLTATVVFAAFYAPSGSSQRRTGARDARLMYVASCVLHVLNATLSPLIMILRGRSLKSALRSEISSFRSRFSSQSESQSTIGRSKFKANAKIGAARGVKTTVYRY